MGWISADGFVLLGFGVRFLLVVGFFLFFPQKLPSSFCSAIDIHRGNYLYKVTVNHALNFSFTSCSDRDFFFYYFPVSHLCLKVYRCCSFHFSLQYLSNITGILE